MTETLNQRWSAAIVGELVGAGVQHVVVCPGSRSTPLALAFIEARPAMHVYSVVDERSAAFVALGLAKASGSPAAVVCTSGTAGAHFLPAAIEAKEGGTPLVLLTADRPAELRGFGAPQTIDQSALFGRFARYEGLPEPADELEPHIRAVVAQALSTREVVHFNVPYREPLAPPGGGAGPKPMVRTARFIGAATDPAPHALDEVRVLLRGVERGVILVGPRECPDDGFGEAVHALGDSLGFPVLAEAASNARYGFPNAIAVTDAMVRHPYFAKTMRPQVVLRFGGGLTPKTVQHWLDQTGAKLVVFAEREHVLDPSHRSVLVVRGHATAAARALVGAVKTPAAYANSWQSAQQKVLGAWQSLDQTLSEPAVAKHAVQSLQAGEQLVVSSSMPIRDVDAFASSGAEKLRVFSNRGVNGIDGVTSTALGVALASGKRTVLLIGDLAVLHDLGGLLAARRLGASLTVVVTNNDGGGIFSFLPVAQSTPHYEELFGTPHGIDFAHVAALSQATHHRADSVATLQQALTASARGGLHLIEARTDRAQNVTTHRELFAAAATALGEGEGWA